MAGQWYYGIAENRLGPVSVQQLQQLVASGQIGPQTLVWSDGMPQWVPANTLPFLTAMANQNNSAGLNLLLPIGPQSGFAIAAGYLGLIGMLFAPLGVLAIILAVLALREIKAHPEKRGTGRAITGIVGGLIGCAWWIPVFVLHL